MKTLIERSRGQIKLVIDAPGRGRGERDVLALMTLQEGTGCWSLEDIRLTERRKPSPYWGNSGTEYFATFTPRSEDERTRAKALLRDAREVDGVLVWCTFDGIVRGQPAINGYTPPGDFQCGWWSMRDGLAKLQEAQAFWDGFEGDPATVRLPNPDRQPGESAVFYHCYFATPSHVDSGDPSPPSAVPRGRARP